MSLGERIQESFKAEEDTILENNLDRAQGLFQYHDDETINLAPEVREAPTKIQILVYLIAKRLIYEAEDAESKSLTYSYLYEKFDVADSSIRAYVKQLRDGSLIRSNDGEHSVVVENLPRAFDIIEAAIEN